MFRIPVTCQLAIAVVTSLALCYIARVYVCVRVCVCVCACVYVCVSVTAFMLMCT